MSPSKFSFFVIILAAIMITYCICFLIITVKTYLEIIQNNYKILMRYEAIDLHILKQSGFQFWLNL